MVSLFGRRLARYFFWASFGIAYSVPACCQSFHFGVKAGVPITKFFETGFFPFLRSGTGVQYSAATRRYTVGVTAEYRLSHGLGFEVDAQYKRMGYIHDETSTYFGYVNTQYFDVKGHSWDFPALMKYRFGRQRRPFVSVGGTFRHMGPARARGQSTVNDPFPVLHTITTAIDTAHPEELEDRNFSGLTLGGGFEFRRGWLRFLPELRFTHWVTNMGTVPNALRLDPHQLEFLLGVEFLHRR